MLTLMRRITESLYISEYVMFLTDLFSILYEMKEHDKNWHYDATFFKNSVEV